MTHLKKKKFTWNARIILHDLAPKIPPIPPPVWKWDDEVAVEVRVKQVRVDKHIFIQALKNRTKC